MRRRGHREEKSPENLSGNTSYCVDNRDEHLLEVFETAKTLFAENVKSVENFMTAESKMFNPAFLIH